MEKPTNKFQIEPWSILQIRTKAQYLGKDFNPTANALEQLRADLEENNVIFLFTPDEVEFVISRNLIPKALKDDLLEIVSPNKKNDIAVINLDSINPELANDLSLWFLTNSRC